VALVEVLVALQHEVVVVEVDMPDFVVGRLVLVFFVEEAFVLVLLVVEAFDFVLVVEHMVLMALRKIASL
jgi:hypothetical protein